MGIPNVTDGELSVLGVLWDRGAINATEIVKELGAAKGWNRNTTYTFINRLVKKGIVRREEPGFRCVPLYSREEVSISETEGFVERMFSGSIERMVSTFLSRGNIGKDDLERIEQLIREKKEADS